ncbi:hypothetical protein FRB96_009015 [Tulasnella sp. 330]|nr:hypothetical protein FRB96_009015 [Tulasnella sp. 330]KAG8872476.1 hypothetical protein FRB97_007585 [Tulasnella sp. 331]KAG8875821.1 hypothetical protein FRB98_007567 [Tulasnella sp. 332]
MFQLLRSSTRPIATGRHWMTPIAGPSSLLGLSVRKAHDKQKAPINENIPFETVQCRQADTSLGPPTSLTTLLSRIDKAKEICILLSRKPPVVTIMSKQEALEKRKADKEKLKAQKAAQAESKVIQMTWGVEAGDLTHKVAKMKRELEKGNHVELILAKKKKVPVPPPAEREERVTEIVTLLQDVAREISRTRTPFITTVSLRPVKQETPPKVEL